MDVHKETLGSCNRDEEKICVKKGKGVSIIEGRKRRSVRVYLRTIEKGVY